MNQTVKIMSDNVGKTLKMGIIGFLVIMFAVLTLCGEAKADAQTLKFKNKQTITLTEFKNGKKNEGFYYVLLVQGLKKNEKVISGKSNNKKSVGIMLDPHGFCSVIIKKAGKAKVTLTIYNTKKKTKRKISGTFKIVKKFTNPFKNLVVDGKKQTVKSQDTWVNIKTTKSEVKVTYKLKKNWKVCKKAGYLTPFGTIKKFRSGKKIKNNSSTVLYLKNSKTKAEAAVTFNVSKPIEMDDEIDDDYFEDDSDFDLE